MLNYVTVANYAKKQLYQTTVKSESVLFETECPGAPFTNMV